jgi:hypothetical protein
MEKNINLQGNIVFVGGEIDIAEILLKVVLNTISHKPNRISCINSLSIELTIMFNYITHNALDRI